VRFIAEGMDGTGVELEHRHPDRCGARRDGMHAIFDSERGWSGLLEAFARAASAQTGERHVGYQAGAQSGGRADPRRRRQGVARPAPRRVRQRSTVGPWGLTYINPKDDPRPKTQ
jgi:hypothetical protein